MLLFFGIRRIVWSTTFCLYRYRRRCTTAHRLPREHFPSARTPTLFVFWFNRPSVFQFNLRHYVKVKETKKHTRTKAVSYQLKTGQHLFSNHKLSSISRTRFNTHAILSKCSIFNLPWISIKSLTTLKAQYNVLITLEQFEIFSEHGKGGVTNWKPPPEALLKLIFRKFCFLCFCGKFMQFIGIDLY